MADEERGDVRSFPGISGITGIASLGSRLFFFPVLDHLHPKMKGLWVLDGTEEETRVLFDLGQGEQGTGLIAMGERIYYLLSGGDFGTSNGTVEGTSIVLHLEGLPYGLRQTGGLLYFFVEGNTYALWVSDGTREGTHSIWAGSNRVDWRDDSPLGERFNFRNDQGESWITDGTVEGTVAMECVQKGPFCLYGAAGISPGNHRSYSWMLDGAGVRVLWTSDGTLEGTLPLGEIPPAVHSRLGTVQEMLAGDRFYFAADDGVRSPQIWTSDGTLEGTRAVGVLPSEWGYWVGTVEENLYLIACEGDCAGPQVWQLFQIDGARARIDLVYRFSGGPLAVETECETGVCWSWIPNPSAVAVWPEKRLLLFSGGNGTTGVEPWALPLDPHSPEPRFHRGDPNASGTTDLSDAIAIFGYLFLGSESPTCLESADVNNSGAVDISDGIAILNWLFTGGPEPASPGASPASCGSDTDPKGSEGDLGCESYAPCQ